MLYPAELRARLQRIMLLYAEAIIASTVGPESSSACLSGSNPASRKTDGKAISQFLVNSFGGLTKIGINGQATGWSPKTQEAYDGRQLIRSRPMGPAEQGRHRFGMDSCRSTAHQEKIFSFLKHFLLTIHRKQ